MTVPLACMCVAVDLIFNELKIGIHSTQWLHDNGMEISMHGLDSGDEIQLGG